MSAPINVALIVSRFNASITEKLYEGANAYLLDRGLAESAITTAWVPGAVEIPLIAQKLAQQNRYDAIIALGAVIRGETGHYDYVCEQVSAGCGQVMLAYDIPVIFGVLTTENMAQALDRVGGAHGHKGAESAEAALDMIALMRKLDSPELSSTSLLADDAQ